MDKIQKILSKADTEKSLFIPEKYIAKYGMECRALLDIAMKELLRDPVFTDPNNTTYAKIMSAARRRPAVYKKVINMITLYICYCACQKMQDLRIYYTD